MKSEPYKIKEVKQIRKFKPYERWNILKKVNFNTFHVSSDYITFDMISRGMSSWSHFQKAGYMIGDEAYAGSRNYIHLEKSTREVFGISQLVPTHNAIGAEKLLTSTMIQKDQYILHNRGIRSDLVEAHGGRSLDVISSKAVEYNEPQFFGGNVDLKLLRKHLSDKTKSVAYIHIETCPENWNSQPVSFENLKSIRELAVEFKVPLVLDGSHIMENAFWIQKVEKPDADLLLLVKEIFDLADIILMDASKDCRSDIGGFIASENAAYFEKFRNQVVVFEGLHTYGGMTGRAMEVFAIGIEELQETGYIEWYNQQIDYFFASLKKNGVPAFRGGTGIALDVEKFFPHLSYEDYPKFVLAATLFILGGLRGRIDGEWKYHTEGEGRKVLSLDLPRNAYTKNQLDKIADVITSAYAHRNEISGLRLTNEPEFVDEITFKPDHHRLFVSFPQESSLSHDLYEPYKIAIFEPLKIMDKEYRKEAVKKAGYNTFLLNSEDVYIDFLTDSGTSAMSCFQWEGMTNSVDTPYSSKHYLNLVHEFSEILGYNYIIPTHQGRAAEHIMSQVMIKPGQVVPGNMYFTTTKLHQELAGGIFEDIIVDEAHDPNNNFPWKGNIDLEKLNAVITKYGPENVAYISFEMSVNMAGGQPFSMQNVKDVSRICQRHGIPVMFDATRCVENSYMVKKKDPDYCEKSVREILREMLSYGDGCTISCKKDFLVNMGGILACNSRELATKFTRMLRAWEGDITNGGMDPKDLEALYRGLLDSLDDEYIKTRIEQTQEFGKKLIEAGIPIVVPPGSHAIFIDAKRFFPHIDQDQYPAQALASAIYIETGVRTMERGNVSKGRNPKTGENYRPALELVRCTIPRRVYTNSHIDYVVDGIKRLYKIREQISGLKFVYEPKLLRFFQGQFEPLSPWPF